VLLAANVREILQLASLIWLPNFREILLPLSDCELRVVIVNRVS